MVVVTSCGWPGSSAAATENNEFAVYRISKSVENTRVYTRLFALLSVTEVRVNDLI